MRLLPYCTRKVTTDIGYGDKEKQSNYNYRQNQVILPRLQHPAV